MFSRRLPLHASSTYLRIEYFKVSQPRKVIMAVTTYIILFFQAHLPEILLVVITLFLLYSYSAPGISSVPGPFLAKISHVWRFINVAQGHAEATLCKLHQQYGEYVRIGPNVVSISNLETLKVVYGINARYRKVGLSPELALVKYSLPLC